MKTLSMMYSPLAIALAIAFVQTDARAAEADADAPPGRSRMATLDQVDVVGAGRIEPIDEEREAIGVVDIEATGDVALFSQTNVVDLAKRLPGVSVSFDQGRNQTATGEAQYVTIRGFDTSYNAYTLDGLRLPQTQSSRAIPMNLFSPFAVAGIVADKTPGADKDADAIAGNVDLRSPTAYDFDGPMLRVRGTGQLAQLAEKRDQDALGGAIGIDGARRFGADQQFGIYAAAYYENRDSVAESIALHDNWYSTFDNGVDARGNEDALSPRGLEYNFFRSEIERYGASTSLDFQGDDVRLFGRFNYAVYNNDNTMDQLTLRSEAGGYGADGRFRAYAFDPSQYFRTEDVRQKLFSGSVGGEWKLGDVDLSLVGGYANGHFDQPQKVTGSFRNTSNTSGQAPLSLDTSNPKAPVLTPEAQAALGSIADPAEFYVQRDYAYMREIKKTLKADMLWNGSGVLAALGAGALYERSERNGITTANLPSSQSRHSFAGAGYANVGQAPGEYLDGFMTPLPRGLKLLDRSAMIARAHAYVPTLEVGEDGLISGDETRAALYAHAKLLFTGGFGELQVVPGLRYERNRFNGDFWVSDGENSTFDTSRSDYGQLAPSLLATWRPDDAFVVRAAVRSSYSRPAFDQLAGTTSISRDGTNDEITAIAESNPDLKPVEAWSYDLGVEYHGGRNRYVQLALYHKELENIIMPTTSYPGYEGTTSIGGIAYSRPENGLTGKATGMEVAGRYGLGDLLGDSWLSGFGIGANATWQNTRARYLVNVDGASEVRRTDLPEAPGLIYNAELFYDDGRLRANLWYSYTGKRMTTVQTSRPDVYIQPLKELNFGVAYAVSDAVEVGASVRNLLDSHSYWTTLGSGERYISVDRSGGYLETGRVFQLSLTMTF